VDDPVFNHEVFLSHSAKDKAVVRAMAERLRQDGPNPKAEGRAGTSAFSLSFGRSARTGRSWKPARSGFATR